MTSCEKKRVSLYFNLDDTEDRLIWEQLSVRKKSQYIKRLILNDIDNKTFPTPIQQEPVKKEDNKIFTDTEEVLEEFPDDIF